MYLQSSSQRLLCSLDLADAAMEPSPRPSVLLLQNSVEAAERRSSELSSRHDSSRAARARSYFLPGHLALRPSNACGCIHRWPLPDYAKTLPTEVSCHETIPKTNIRGAGHSHNGRPIMEDLERDLQPWLQCGASDDLDKQHHRGDKSILRDPPGTLARPSGF